MSGNADQPTPVEQTLLTWFHRHATAEQKQALRAKVIRNAIARQKRVLEEAQKKPGA
ncbi:hypothetical protein HOP52_19380 [Halomonas campisalis]|uniref:Uncharacterized protein n=1 Tax=Billgrantia campisalis TaxID=74661 RepID=A0ABS9PE19_9GAMM|nr:hypothetical protein [Halomonas campisalis]MCG6659906.1 hypothetical protein [Halomonas campisalis]MDR5865113.1 hypothetical protein [Halomonas campisalis]